MPPRARPVKPANKMVTDDAAAAAAATLKTPAAGPSARPASVTAVPSKSSRTLFAEDDSESLTLSAKLAALRIEQAAGGKADKGKAKDTDFKDAVSDAEDDAAGDEDQDAPDAARCVNFMDDEDDGLQAHDPKECFEDKAKEDLAAKLRCVSPTCAVAATVATTTTRIILKDPVLVLVSTAGNREEWVCLLECCEKAKGSSFEQAAHHALSQRHRGGLGNQGAATHVLKDKLNLRVLRKEVAFFRDVLGPFLSGLNCSGKLMLAGDLIVVEDPDLDKSPGFVRGKWQKPDLPKTLRDREKEELEADWTKEEVKKALKEMACDKSPGGDGLPKELFERHWDLLRKDFMGFIKQFESSAVLPEEVQEVVTILLYKKGPREQVHNYRPITLLSSCYKVVAKLLANRMKQVLGTVISEEQHRFLPGRRLSDAVSTVADVIEAANNNKEDWYLLMIDFQKVFDSVSRSFLFDTMALMGFPSKFIRWCEGLHDGSFTRLLVNGWLGDRVDVRKGVRQGCPLAPYLFLCAVEPICQEAKRRKLGINDHHADRLAYLGYADDTTLVLKGKRQIERAEELLEEFGARSGLRVNKDKSALLPLGANLKETRSVSSDFAWVNPKDAERLLGVWVSPSRSAEVTWDKALARAAEELVKWQSHHLATTARVAVVNAYVCPNLEFQGQIYPPSESVWKRIMKLLVNFISGNKASAERHFMLWSRELIFRPWKDGGLGFGVPLVGVAETTAVLPLDKVEALMVRGGRVIGAGGLHEVRLCCSELCMEDQLPPLKQLRLLFGAQQGVMQQ
ncbi:unnamed protein product [Closterium sp. NIES-65]|nr:unnamed protein product [Closterium sp. NIES-65]